MENSSFSEKCGAKLTRQVPAVNDSLPGGAAGRAEAVNGSGAGKKQLVKAAGLVGLMTLSSRILGMIRDVVSAKTFGTSWQWDAFVYSFMLPNFLRRLVGEGALSNAFIPVYSETLEKNGREAAFRFANSVITFLGIVLILFLIATEAVLNLLLNANILPPGPHLTVDLLRLMFPYLWFISLFAMGMGILNCHKHFFAPSLGPVILDLVWIAGVLWLVPMAGDDPVRQLKWLAWAILFSGAVQVAAEIPPLYRMGFRFRMVWDILHPGMKKTGMLLLPSVMSFAVVQINILVDSTLAFLIGPGANSSLWYGTRIMQFPLGVFAIAMGTALLPAISTHVARNDFEKAKQTLSFALRSVFLIILPSTVGLIVLGTPIVRLLFERGEFDAVSTSRTAFVLMCYSIGLFGYSGQKLVASGFYALQDPKTPVKIGVAALIMNVVLNLILMGPLKEGGLALATSIAGIFQFIALLAIYHRKTVGFDLRRISRSFLKISLASCLMGGACYYVFGWTTALFHAGNTLSLFAQIFVSITVSTVFYILLCFLLRVREIEEAFSFAGARFKKTGIKK